jgi:metal-responsive CopG/Arc/MetJ family transcriptional regulator
MEEQTAKVQINFQVDYADAQLIDELSREDGYDNRSAWIRSVLRKFITTRTAKSTLPALENELLPPQHQ